MPWISKDVRFILMGRKYKWPEVDKSERHGKSWGKIWGSEKTKM